jgi:hypothetical protein
MTSQQTRKLKIDIFVPMSRCACDWQGFMDQVFEVLMPHMKEIEFDTKDSSTSEAKTRKLPSHCIVIGEEVFISSSVLKSRLPSLISR